MAASTAPAPRRQVNVGPRRDFFSGKCLPPSPLQAFIARPGDPNGLLILGVGRAPWGGVVAMASKSVHQFGIRGHESSGSQFMIGGALRRARALAPVVVALAFLASPLLSAAAAAP